MTSSASISVVQWVIGGAMLVAFIFIVCKYPMPQSKNAWIARLLLLALGIFSAAIAILAVCTGHMRITRFIRPYYLTPAMDPVAFWGRVAICSVLAAVAFYAALRKR